MADDHDLQDAVTQAIPVVAPPPVEAQPPVRPTPASAPAPARLGRRFRRLGIGIAGVLLAALLVIVVIGSGSPASGDTPQSSSSVPAWMSQLAADYAAACGGTLDQASLQGFDQEEATDQVASLIDACGSPSQSPRGKGKDRGHGHG